MVLEWHEGPDMCKKERDETTGCFKGGRIGGGGCGGGGGGGGVGGKV
jgi:hypothetical protein